MPHVLMVFRPEATDDPERAVALALKFGYDANYPPAPFDNDRFDGIEIHSTWPDEPSAVAAAKTLGVCYPDWQFSIASLPAVRETALA